MNMQSVTKQEAKYTIRVEYMPDQAKVRSVTIWNEGMESTELGEVVAHINEEYRPLKFIILNS